jgi:transcriptional regulator with XRE-family HTH domain
LVREQSYAPKTLGGTMRDTKFATALRERRKASGLTQAQVASLCDVSTVTVWNWEKGRSAPWSKDQAKILLRLSKDDIGEEVNDGNTSKSVVSVVRDIHASVARAQVGTTAGQAGPITPTKRRLIDNFGDIKC